MKSTLFSLFSLALTVSLTAMSLSASSDVPATGECNGHDWVDLGLSVKWATCNLGAASPSQSGDYYAWGETALKKEYTWSTYKYCKANGDNCDVFLKYNTEETYGEIDNKTLLELTDDAARVNWGGSWRMPTKEEFEELIENCTVKWVDQGSIRGCFVTSKKNGNSIFFPAAGFFSGESAHYVRNIGFYWTSAFDPDDDYLQAWTLELNSSLFWVGKMDRFCGNPIRPVLE